MMPKKVRPYGSGADAEYAGLSRGRSRGEHVSELASMLTVRELAAQAAASVAALNDLTGPDGDLRDVADVRDVAASLQLMAHSLPQLCEHLARFVVTEGEDRRVSAPAYALAEVTEALTAASQAADMLAAALDQARSATELVES